MKKLFIFAALAFGLAACETKNEESIDAVVNGDKAVEFTINVVAPEAEETRAANWSNSAAGAISNGLLGTPDDNVTLRYILEIYDAAGRPSSERYIQYSDDRNVSFNPRLIPDRNYTFVVWADIVTRSAEGQPWGNNLYNVGAISEDTPSGQLRNVTIYADNWKPMDEMRDAYTGFVADKLDGAHDIKVTLTRPFAKLRVVTEDMAAVNALDVVPTKAKIVYTTPYRIEFNAMTGTYTAAVDANKKTHDTFEIANYDSNVAGVSKALFTDYFFADTTGTDKVGFTMEVYDGADELIKATEFTTDIPVKRNTLTTITGKFLTVQDGNYAINVEVSNDGDFATPEIVEDR